ncbi:hypothetical protein M433DRAFT_4826 [Acidomyces richmondensis BFW]|nr:hypothetical protein M433DRAFT_4826 [Acidomyces richmondensis BFW]
MDNSPFGCLPAELRNAIYEHAVPLEPLKTRLPINTIACLRDGHERKLSDAFPEHTIILYNTSSGLQPCSRQWTTPHPFALMQVCRQMRVETRQMFYAANPCVLTLDQPGRFRTRDLLASFANLHRWLLDLDAQSFGETPLRLLVRVATALDGASAQQAELYVSVLTCLQMMVRRYNLAVTFQFRVKADGKEARVCLPLRDHLRCLAAIDEAVDLVDASAEMLRMFEGGRAAASRLLAALERCEGTLDVMRRKLERIMEGQRQEARTGDAETGAGALYCDTGSPARTRWGVGLDSVPNCHTCDTPTAIPTALLMALPMALPRALATRLRHDTALSTQHIHPPKYPPEPSQVPSTRYKYGSVLVNVVTVVVMGLMAVVVLAIPIVRVLRVLQLATVVVVVVAIGEVMVAVVIVVVVLGIFKRNAGLVDISFGPPQASDRRLDYGHIDEELNEHQTTSNNNTAK